MTATFALATFCYFIGMIKYLLHLGLRNRTLFILATVMIAIGFALETVGLYQRSLVTGHGPYTNVYEYLVFLGWVVFGVFLVAEGYFKLTPLGAFMAPIGFLLMLISFAFSPEMEPGLPVRAWWLTMHRTLSFLSFGAFSLVFAAGVMYLIQERQLKHKRFGGWYHRLPPLGALDDVNRVGIIFGFPIITVSALAAMIWSSQSYGKFLFNYSIAILLAGWLIYAVLIAGRFSFGWRGKRAAAMGVAGYAVMITALVIHFGSK